MRCSESDFRSERQQLKQALRSAVAEEVRLLIVFKLLVQFGGRILNADDCRDLVALLPDCSLETKCYVGGKRVSDEVVRDVTVILVDRINDYLACCHGTKPSIKVTFKFVILLARLRLSAVPVCKLLLKNSIQVLNIMASRDELMSVPHFSEFTANLVELASTAVQDKRMFLTLSGEATEKTDMLSFRVQLARTVLSWPWLVDDKCILLIALVPIAATLPDDQTFANEINHELDSVFYSNSLDGYADLAKLVQVLLEFRSDVVWNNLEKLFPLAMKSAGLFDAIVTEAVKCRKFEVFLEQFGSSQVGSFCLDLSCPDDALRWFWSGAPTRLHPKLIRIILDVKHSSLKSRLIDTFLETVPFDASSDNSLSSLISCRLTLVSELSGTSRALTYYTYLLCDFYKIQGQEEETTSSKMSNAHPLSDSLLPQMLWLRQLKSSCGTVVFSVNNKRRKSAKGDCTLICANIFSLLCAVDLNEFLKLHSSESCRLRSLLRDEFRLSLPCLVSRASRADNCDLSLKRLALWCVDLGLFDEIETYDDEDFAILVTLEIAQRVLDILNLEKAEKLDKLVSNGLKHSLLMNCKSVRRSLSMEQLEKLLAGLKNLAFAPFEISKRLHCVFTATVLTCLLSVEFVQAIPSSQTLLRNLLSYLDASLSNVNKRLTLWTDVNLIAFLPSIVKGVGRCVTDGGIQELLQSVTMKAMKMSGDEPLKLWRSCFALLSPVRFWAIETALGPTSSVKEIRESAIQIIKETGVKFLGSEMMERLSNTQMVSGTEAFATSDEREMGVEISNTFDTDWLVVFESVASCSLFLKPDEFDFLKRELAEASNSVLRFCLEVETRNWTDERKNRVCADVHFCRLLRVTHFFICNVMSRLWSDLGECLINEQPQLINKLSSPIRLGCALFGAFPVSEETKKVALCYAGLFDKTDTQWICDELTDILDSEGNRSVLFSTCVLAKCLSKQGNLSKRTERKSRERWSNLFEKSLQLSISEFEVNFYTNSYLSTVEFCQVLLRRHGTFVTERTVMLIFEMMSSRLSSQAASVDFFELLSAEMRLLDDLSRLKSKMLNERSPIYVSITMAILKLICELELAGDGRSRESTGDRSVLSIQLAEQFGHLIGQMVRSTCLAMFRYMAITFTEILHSTFSQPSPNPLLISSLTSTFNKVLHACKRSDLDYISLNMPSHLAEFYAELLAEYKRYFEYKGEA